MKKLLLLVLAGLLLLPATVLAQEATEPAGEQAAQGDGGQGDTGAVTEIPWGQMDDRQIALMIISRQMDYLMGQVEANREQLAQVEVSYEEKLARENQQHREELRALEEKLAAKDATIEELREEVKELERQIALYNSENAVYLKMLISLLVGVLGGLVLGAILRWWKYRLPAKTQLGV